MCPKPCPGPAEHPDRRTLSPRLQEGPRVQNPIQGLESAPSRETPEADRAEDPVPRQHLRPPLPRAQAGLLVGAAGIGLGPVNQRTGGQERGHLYPRESPLAAPRGVDEDQRLVRRVKGDRQQRQALAQHREAPRSEGLLGLQGFAQAGIVEEGYEEGEGLLQHVGQEGDRQPNPAAQDRHQRLRHPRRTNHDHVI